MIKSNKGYSLIEIGVGILILTVFLIVSVGLFNGCYSNYRRIKQRNIAIDRAVYYMENMLQTNSNVLAGFLIQDYDPTTNSYVYTPNSYFRNYIQANFDKFGKRYADFAGIALAPGDSVAIPSLEKLDKYIVSDITYLSNYYIADDAYNYTSYFRDHASTTQLQNGTYGFFTDSGRLASGDNIITIENEQLISDGNSYISSNGGAFRVKKYISRIPVLYDDGKITEVYGNNVLVLKVEVYYTFDFSKEVTEDNSKVITLTTVKTM